MSLLDEITAKLGALGEVERAELVEQALTQTEYMRFVPLEGPQTEAYLSAADILLYGGQAGGGKSYLLMGLASQEHQSAIVFRRESAQTDGLEKSGKEIIGDTARYNGTDKEWTWPSGRSLKLAGMKEPGDWNKHAGRERDLIGFDEAGEFLREQVASLIAWLRAPEGQRCRMVLASNPPRSADGYWMKEWFAPWLDMQFADPAEPGELRWALMIDGSPHWVEGPGEYEYEGEHRQAISLTFIPAALSDNPYRNTPEYRARLQSLPEPLRSQLLRGDFDAGMEDGANQTIPTSWVKAAMERWTPQAPTGVPMCAIGVDVAQGGTDKTTYARRYSGWYAPIETIPGIETPSGQDVAGRILAKRYDGAKVIVDLGGGWGGDALAHLVKNNIDAIGYMGVKTSTKHTRDNKLRFFNVRTEAYWRFREALDPYQREGSFIDLPNDRELLADLTAPTYEIKRDKGGMVIHLESKEALVKRLGRSPDKGDAVVMAWWAGEKIIDAVANDQAPWRSGDRGGRTPKVVMSKRYGGRN